MFPCGVIVPYYSQLVGWDATFELLMLSAGTRDRSHYWPAPILRMPSDDIREISRPHPDVPVLLTDLSGMVDIGAGGSNTMEFYSGCH